MRLAVSITLAAFLAVVASATTASAEPSRSLADCTRGSTGLVPLTDLGRRKYRGYRGGLYPNVRNRPSPAYLKVGTASARRVRPIDGKIVLLSIGMSNTTAEFGLFKRLADRDKAKSANVTIVDGAQGGADAETIKTPDAAYWEFVEERLAAAGATDAQVQAIWLKEAIAGESRAFPRDARALQADLRLIVQLLRDRFPNLRLIFLSSRTYAGYAITGLNPEPHAYDSAFAVRWLIQERMQGKLRGPWLGWGPYLWTDGLRGRRDGLVWTCDDVGQDGTHPSKSGAQKVADRLLVFFKTDPTARPWFRARVPRQT
jgi:hypothetical protein